MKKQTTKDFETCIAALNFIDELKKKNKKCEGLLNNTPKEITVINGNTGKKAKEFEYTWHVTYDAELLKDLSRLKKETSKRS